MAIRSRRHGRLASSNSCMMDLSQLRVCWLAGTLGQGGAERQLFYLVQTLRQSGANVRVLSLDQGAFWEQRIREMGVTVDWVGQERSRLKRLFRIAKELKRQPVDVIQAQHFYTNTYASLAARLANCKAIGAMRSNGTFDVLQCGRLAGRMNLRLPGMLAANSKSAIRYALAQGVQAARLYFLPNAVDTERFNPAASEVQRPLTLVAVGRLTREKRFDRFLSLLHAVRNEHRLNVRGLIVGPTRPDQDLRPELEQQASALGLLPHGVQILGSVSDVSSLYQQADICVLTSDHEGTPNVLLEAMATGLPVVATKVGGVPDIVFHGQTGFLAASHDLKGLEQAIVSLIRNPELRIGMGTRARAYVEATHSLQQLPARLNALYGLVSDLNTKPNHKSTTARLWTKVSNIEGKSRVGCCRQSTTHI